MICHHCNKNPLILKSFLAILSLILIYTFLFLFLDKPIAQFFQTIPSTNIFYKTSLAFAKIFSPTHILGLAIITFGIGFARKNKSFKIIGASGILAFIIAGFFKVILARYRPIELFDHGKYGFHFLSNHYEFNSTPSGHTKMFFAVLGSIASILKNKWLWIALISICVLVAFSRVFVSAHFFSDVVFGAYTGLLSIYWVKYFYA